MNAYLVLLNSNFTQILLSLKVNNYYESIQPYKSTGYIIMMISKELIRLSRVHLNALYMRMCAELREKTREKGFV